MAGKALGTLLILKSISETSWCLTINASKQFPMPFPTLRQVQQANWRCCTWHVQYIPWCSTLINTFLPMVFLYNFWIVSIRISGRYIILVSVWFFCIAFVCNYKNAQSAQCTPFLQNQNRFLLTFAFHLLRILVGRSVTGVRVFLRMLAMPCIDREELLSATACAWEPQVGSSLWQRWSVGSLFIKNVQQISSEIISQRMPSKLTAKS